MRKGQEKNKKDREIIKETKSDRLRKEKNMIM